MTQQITISDLDSLLESNNFFCSEAQHLKINNYIDECYETNKNHHHNITMTYINQKDKNKSKLKIVIDDFIKVFLKVKTQERKDLEQQQKDNDTFNSWDNRHFWD